MIDPLYEQVLADPEDDALREVWGDALIERGDPLGELIALQIATRSTTPTREQDNRMRVLIARHCVEWLGRRLARVVQHRSGLVFDRGLLAQCQLKVSKVGALASAVGDPRWTGLRTIYFCDKFAWDPRIVPLLVHPVMRSLREVFAVGLNNVFVALARHDRPLPFTTLWAIDDEFRRPDDRVRDVRTAPGLPMLRRLGFHGRIVEHVLELPIVRNIATLGLVNEQPAGVCLERTLRFESLEALELRRRWLPMHGPLRHNFVLLFTRGPDGHWRELTIEPSGRLTAFMLEQELASIAPDTLTRITAPVELHAQLARFTRAEVVSPRQH
jgi:uncharacterized protein (TIGR02996 family)